MPRVTVRRPFHDLVEGVRRIPGDAFDADGKRVRQLLRNLPQGYVTVEADPEPASEPERAPEATDWSKLTVRQLTEELAARGVKVPKGAKKADLVRLIGG